MRTVSALILSVFLLAGAALAIDWFPTNQKTIAWDPVITLEDGSSVPAGDTIKYNVYVKDRSSSDVVFLGEVSETYALVTVSHEGFFYVGIETVRYLADQSDPELGKLLSANIAWSNDPIYCQDGKIFGLRYHVPPGQVKNERAQ